MSERVVYPNGGLGNWPFNVNDFSLKSTNASTAEFAAGVHALNGRVYVKYVDFYGSSEVFSLSRADADALRDALNQVSAAPLVVGP